jgi:SAM-dependent methyltransferase
MPGVEDNRSVWERDWDWSRQGEEWSDWWGGTQALWSAVIAPRIQPFVPTGTILEIGPGYGRWSDFLKDLCDRLVLVDLTEGCVAHCRERFAGETNIEYHVNDGRSLAMVQDRSVDFAFSFDSLVHAEADVVGDYLRQLGRKLKPDGVGFIHHSNLARYRRAVRLARMTPESVRRRLVKAGAMVNIYSWRAESMTAELFATQCEEAGLSCTTQEKIAWQSGPYLTDALSTFTPRGSRWDRPARVLRNPLFGREAKRTSRLYASSSFPPRRGSGNSSP